MIDEAIVDFSKVIDLDSNHVNALLYRAACYNKLGEYALAIEDYNLGL